MKNNLGYEVLSDLMTKKMMGPTVEPHQLTDAEIIEIVETFQGFNLEDPRESDKNFKLKDDTFTVDKLLGNNIEEHFEMMSRDLVGDVRAMLDEFAAVAVPSFPEFFDNFNVDPYSDTHGWYKWTGKYWEDADDAIENEVAIFDCETFVQSPCGNWAIMATAMDKDYFYIWIHEAFHYDKEFYKELIDPGNIVKILIGQNVCFDYARVDDSYQLKNSSYIWIDTRSMFNICHGLTSNLMATFESHEFDLSKNPYGKYGAKADLVSEYNFYYRDIEPMERESKKIRDVFVDSESIREMHEVASREDLYKYAMKDVYYTFLLFIKVWPEYQWHCPTDTALASMIILGAPKLPLDDNWYAWFEECERIFHEKQEYIGKTFKAIADDIMEHVDDIDIENDPWLCQMDWSANTQMGKRITKEYIIYDKEGCKHHVTVNHGEKVGEVLEAYVKNDAPDYFIRTKSGKVKNKKINEKIEMEPTYPHLYGIPKWYLNACNKPITTKGRLSHYLLGLKWLGEPIFMTDNMGWCINKNGEVQKVPHKDGKEFNVGNMLTKDFIEYYEQGLMEARNDKAKALMDAAVCCSYWLSVRSRVGDVRITKVTNPYGSDALMCGGEVSPHNTVSGRGGQRLWYTVPGAQEHKIGTEIKTRVKAPEGWDVVGGDIDGQELQIFSMYADCKYNHSGSSPVAYSVLLGNKQDKTEPHWLLATLANIARKGAKTINYGIQYGAGFPTVDKTLAKLNPTMPENERHALVEKILKLKKGYKNGKGRHARYYGGMDSEGFNYMLDLLDELMPRTPFLDTLMSQAIMPNHDVHNRNFTSIQNWTIQRSGADFLACMVVACNYLSKKYNLGALFMISMHDEIFYLVPSQNKMKFAACFLMAHMWTWTYFHYKLGLYDVPLRRLFISGVYVGNRWSKSLDSTQTISNPKNDQEGYEVNEVELLPIMSELFAS